MFGITFLDLQESGKKMAEIRLSRSFSCLNAVQFLGALNDNLLKLLLIAFLIGRQGWASAGRTAALGGAVFVTPFLLFMAFAGKLADRFSKRNIVVAVKVVEVAVTAAACVAFVIGSAFLLYCVLFVMAAQSAFFSPSKYGIIPELVRPEQLSRANSFLEAFTYLAIVLGTACAPVLLRLTKERYVFAGLFCAAIAGTGLFFSLFIRQTPAAGGGRSASVLFLRDIWSTLRSIRGDRRLLMAVFASAYFLLMGMFIYINVIPYGMEQLGLSETESGYMFIPAAIGIGAGAFWAGRLSGKKVEFGIVPLGALGVALSSVGLGLIKGRWAPVFGLIFLMGVSAGLFIVPIHTFIQRRSPSKHRGEVLAASSFLGWSGAFVASGLVYLLSSLWSISAARMFAIVGTATLAPALITVIVLPDFLVRFVVVHIAKPFYRIKVTGIENLPVEGGALLVCNHVTWVDALLLSVAQQRRIRFVMDRGFYNIKWLKPLCRLMRAIPISAADPPKEIAASLRRARAALDEGYLVCIFAEGALTRTGMLRGFKSGLERIVRTSKCTIIPAYIGGAWGSIFSYYYGKPLTTLPRKIPYPVSIHFGKPMPAESSANKVRQMVSELSCEYFDSLKPSRRSVAEHFVQVARKNRRRRCMSDSTGKHLNYGRALTGAIALAAEIERITDKEKNIGVLLPPSVGAALANVAITMLGKVAVNLNYVGSERLIESAVEQCRIKTVITSRSFTEKLKNCLHPTWAVFLEDITAAIGRRAEVRAYLQSRLMPRRLLADSGSFGADDLMTIIFSSGSSGEPKGVMLSHHNVFSNIEALRAVFHLKADDNLCGVLPFFHSFGFTCSLWLPLVSGISVVYIANPLDARTVGKFARENRSSILFAAPTFLLNYIRRLRREDFATMRAVVAGAEKLKKTVVDSFEEKFGIRPLEGYGASELSPVVSLNLPDSERGGVLCIGSKEGTVGRVIPGVSVKVVSLEEGAEAALGQAGLLKVKGPNVMLGYLNKPEETAEVLTDGWYNTGDIGSMEEDGFLKITDRLSRFSKIGGEMVPHMGVEEAYLHGLNTTEQVVAVTAVPDPKKGEELVVLHLDKAGHPDTLHEIIARSKLPNIWKPRRDNYVRIDSIPVLGSGKLDVMRLRQIALEAKGK